MQTNENLDQDLSGFKSVFENLIKTKNKIQDLQQFSSNDFTFINQKFLAFHKKNKVLLSYILSIRDKLFENAETTLNFENSIEYIDKISIQFEKIKTDIVKYIDYYRKLNEGLSLINIPLKNYRQNLFTLKLLSANLKIDLATMVRKEQVSEKIDEFIVILENICLFVPKIDQIVEDYQRYTNDLIEDHNKILKSLCNIFNKELKALFELTSYYNNKIIYSKIIYQDIEIANQATLGNVETIITKLQYQDIIRQRIEHIQQTHEETVISFNKILNQGLIDGSSEQVSSQIKDIIGLQSAHLIHINQEFQKAIDTISETCKNYNQHVVNIMDLSMELTGIFSNTGATFETYGHSLEKLLIHMPEIEEDVVKVTNKIKVQETKTLEFTEYFDEIFDISAHIERIYKAIYHVTGSETLSRISGLLKENLDITSRIDSNIKSFKDIYKLFKIENTDILSEIAMLTDIIKSFNSDSFNNLVREISDESVHIEMEVFNNRKEQELNVNALNELKYYQYFEKSVNEIIFLLDEINIFCTNYYRVNNTSEKNIEHIKKRYTTVTEHSVHKKYSSGEEFKIDEFISGIESVGNDENDNIEFF